MIASGGASHVGDEGIIRFKELVSEELTPFATAILLDRIRTASGKGPT